MKNLLFILLFLSVEMMAQPPIPAVDDGVVIAPIDHAIAIAFTLIVVYVIRVLLKKKRQIV